LAVLFYNILPFFAVLSIFDHDWIDGFIFFIAGGDLPCGETWLDAI
jgi:hypothetical protein